MTKRNPVEYAEAELGVHRVHSDAVAARTSLNATVENLKSVAAEVRQTEWAIEEREAEIVGSVDPSSVSSKTALQELIKNQLKLDPQLRKLRKKLSELRSQQHSLEADVRMVEWDIKIAIGRMEELGGLLNFFAATKLKS